MLSAMIHPMISPVFSASCRMFPGSCLHHPQPNRVMVTRVSPVSGGREQETKSKNKCHLACAKQLRARRPVKRDNFHFAAVVHSLEGREHGPVRLQLLNKQGKCRGDGMTTVLQRFKEKFYKAFWRYIEMLLVPLPYRNSSRNSSNHHRERDMIYS